MNWEGGGEFYIAKESVGWKSSFSWLHKVVAEDVKGARWWQKKMHFRWKFFVFNHLWRVRNVNGKEEIKVSSGKVSLFWLWSARERKSAFCANLRKESWRGPPEKSSKVESHREGVSDSEAGEIYQFFSSLFRCSHFFRHHSFFSPPPFPHTTSLPQPSSRRKNVKNLHLEAKEKARERENGKFFTWHWIANFFSVRPSARGHHDELRLDLASPPRDNNIFTL